MVWGTTYYSLRVLSNMMVWIIAEEIDVLSIFDILFILNQLKNNCIIASAYEFRIMST